MASLTDLIYYTAVELHIAYEGTATGGDRDTINDTTLRTENDDYWNGGSGGILYDAGGAGAAPQGECYRVKDFTTAGDAIEFDTNAFSVAVAAGDRYFVTDPALFKHEDIIQAINQALRDLAPYEMTFNTSLTLADDQTEYSLPAAISSPRGIRRVLLQTDTADADDNRWVELPGGMWRLEKTATGTADKIVFDRQVASAGYKVGIEWVGMHPQLRLCTDKLDESLPEEVIAVRAAANLYKMWKSRHHEGRFDKEMQECEAKAQRLLMDKPIVRPGKPGGIVTLDRLPTVDQTGADKVYLRWG